MSLVIGTAITILDLWIYLMHRPDQALAKANEEPATLTGPSGPWSSYWNYWSDSLVRVALFLHLAGPGARLLHSEETVCQSMKFLALLPNKRLKLAARVD